MAITIPIIFNPRDEPICYDYSNIVYMEENGIFTYIAYINKKKAFVCLGFSNMQRLISEILKVRTSTFERVGKRFIINLNFVINVIRQVLMLTVEIMRLAWNMPSISDKVPF